jgi:hypothetical protein
VLFKNEGYRVGGRRGYDQDPTHAQSCRPIRTIGWSV